MRVATASGRTILSGNTVPMSDLRLPLDVDWPESIYGGLYTVAMWKATGSDAPRMHLLIVNTPSEGRVVIPYSTPHDPTAVYQIQVLQQQEKFPLFSAASHSKFTFPVNWKFSRSVGTVNFQVSPDTPLSTGARVPPSNGKAGYFKPDHDLTEGQEKYCRCTLHTMAKQPEDCLAAHNWGPGKPCYNPYSVCAKSTRTSVGRSPKCTLNYNYSGIPDDELRAYAIVEGVSVPSPYNRSTMISNLETWRSGKY